MSRVTTRRFKQEYSFKGVTKAPDAYASEVMAGLRRAYVSAAVSAPWVRIAQFGDIVERGKGTEWRIDYTQREYTLTVLQDVQTGGGQKKIKTPWGDIPDGFEPRVRAVRFQIDVIVVETLSKDTTSMTSMTESDESVDIERVIAVFNEFVKHIPVTSEATLSVDEAIGASNPAV
ncbi:hypothetical protein MGU_10928 [Metarhizium guizhouense ARSEF 977]|uniref:Uncharacterized protein n=1 Tax=Metarhizium guizhouense (strain ARSEF 977) TaxID=1276136 RepID=A0A0B4GGW3_METGA|nr:hypothetical protein MGU_10928 [Metarhizium guizhouense ARSEF 977]